jgi:PilZ domain
MTSADQSESNSSTPASVVERRRNLRFPFSADVEALDIKTGTTIKARTSDLGVGGCYVDTLNPIPLGSDVRIRIVRENESFEAEGTIVFSAMGMGMGVAFVSAQPEHLRLFQKWLLEISGQQPLAPDRPSPDAGDPSPAESAPPFLKTAIFSDLIVTLVQKKVLTETEGQDLLRKLIS